MYFLLEVIYKKPLADVNFHLDAHKAFLGKFYESGNFLISGRKVPRAGGLILADFPSVEEAESAIAHDPFVQHEIAEYRIVEFEPTRCSEELKAAIQLVTG